MVFANIGPEPNGSDWDGLLVLCAANNYDGIKLADQHMAERLAQLRPVLYVDPPMSPLSARKNPALAESLKGPRLRLQAPGLARFTPIVQPFPSRRGVAVLTAALSRILVKRAAAHLSRDVAAVISAWPLYPVLGNCGERVRVYWAQDDFVGGAALLDMDPAALAAGERKSALNSDVIIASNPAVADTWRSRGYNPWLIPFGADTLAYGAVDDVPKPQDVTLSGPIAGFVGHINSRIDLDLLEAIAGRGISLLLVGPRDAAVEPERWAKLLGRANVQWVGPKPFKALPAYLGAIDVGLVPYGASAFNEGSFPLKTLEYLAAGRPVVSTDLPATRWLATDLVTVAKTSEAFAEAVAGWARRPRLPAEMVKRRAFAGQHDWAARARAVLDVIEGADTRVRASA